MTRIWAKVEFIKGEVMSFKKIIQYFLIGFSLVVLTACGGGSTKESVKNTTSSSGPVIKGYVLDDPVSNAEVYIDFGDGISTKAITKSDGSFEIKLTDEDLAKINPEVPEGADGPRSDLLIVAEKDGRFLRNAISRDINSTGIVYITNDTEAYARFLESIGAFDESSLLSFNNELKNGRIKDSSKYAAFIKALREDVKDYFYNGKELSKKDIFEKALQHLGKSELAKIADDRTILPVRNIVSGGDIILPKDVNVSSDEITITPKGNARYTLGDGNDPDKIVYLKISRNDGTFALIPVNIKSKTIIEVAKKTVTPTKGATLGSDEDVKVVIPPFALNEQKEITIKKIETEGESADGKKILDLEPHGTKFQLPITIKINYADFGIEDPYAVQWKYGSLEEGYDYANIVSVDTTNKVIYLNVDHFSELVVKKINQREYLDLGPIYSILIPNRSTRYGIRDIPFYNPYYDENLKNNDNYRIITNRVFPGMSFSSRRGNSSYGGGQCVQFAFNVYWPYKKALLTHNSSKEAFSIYEKELLSKITKKFEKVRTKLDKCQKGDIIIYPYLGYFTPYIDKNDNYIEPTGHVAIFYEYNKSTSKMKILESNWGNHYHKPGSREIFDISVRYVGKSSYLINNNGYSKSNASNSKFLCIDPEYFAEDEDSGKLVKKRRATVLVKESFDDAFHSNTEYAEKLNEKPYLYYLLHLPNLSNYVVNQTLNNSGRINGISKVDNGYKYEPFLLPVAPLRVRFEGNVAKIQNYEDARYEIYAEYKDGATFKTNDGVNLKYGDINITLPSAFGFNGSLTRLALLEKKNTTGDSNKTRLVDSNKTSLVMVGEQIDNRAIEVSGVDKPIKILFSPIVIDDYYVSWGKKNDKKNIPIGFWNEYNYSLEFKGDYTSSTTLEAGKIYRTEKAVNGYFMTLGKEKSAEWHFALAGPHAIYVSVPTLNINDIKNARYELFSRDTGFITILQPIDLNISSLNGLEGSAFNGWIALKAPDGSVSFDFTGNEYIKVTAEDGVVIVDAIRLEGRKDRIERLVVLKTLVDLASSIDKYILQCKLIIENLDNNKKIFKIIPFGTTIKIMINKSLDKALNLRLKYIPVLKDNIENIGNNKRILNKELDEKEILATKYKPMIQDITINPGETEKNIPPVILQPYETKERVKFHLIDAVNSLPIKDANVTVRYGVDNDNNQSIAYSGTTDENGYFEITNIPYGQYTVAFNKDGFIPTSLNITVDGNSSSNYDLSMSPVLAEGEMRIRLSWGEHPRDLDSHLVKYVNGNKEYHIYFAHKYGTNGDNLDRDDTNGYGPETVTIKEVNASAKYIYYVHKFAGDGSIKDSGASVKVSYGNSEQTFYPPQEEGIYWKVFTIENGVIIPCTSNCMGNVEDDVARRILNREKDLFRSLPNKK